MNRHRKRSLLGELTVLRHRAQPGDLSADHLLGELSLAWAASQDGAAFGGGGGRRPMPCLGG